MAPARPGSPAAQFLTASARHAGRARLRARVLYAVVALAALAAVAGAASAVLDRARESSRRQAAQVPLVALPAGTQVDEHEVTYAQYRLCITEEACQPPARSGLGAEFDEWRSTAPVIFVDATQARTFCAWIDRRLPRLPELRAAAFDPRVTHLLEEREAREWTSTRRGIALQTIARDRDAHRVDTSPVNGAHRDIDLGFRCAG